MLNWLKQRKIEKETTRKNKELIDSLMEQGKFEEAMSLMKIFTLIDQQGSGSFGLILAIIGLSFASIGLIGRILVLIGII